MQHGVVRLAPSPGHPAILEPPPSIPGRIFPAAIDDRFKLESDLIAAIADVYEIEVVRRPFSAPEIRSIEALCARYKNLNRGDLSLNTGMT